MVKGHTSSGNWITGVAHGLYIWTWSYVGYSQRQFQHILHRYLLDKHSIRPCGLSRAQQRVCEWRRVVARMRLTMLRIRARMSGRAWPSAAKSSKRSALPRSKRWPRPRKRKARKRSRGDPKRKATTQRERPSDDVRRPFKYSWNDGVGSAGRQP